MCCITQFLIKYVLFFANLVFSLGGLALVGIGVAVVLQLSDALVIVPGLVEAIPITLIVVGVIVFLVAFFGCCGAIKENSCMLTTYSICMGVLAGIKIAVVVLIFNNLSVIDELVSTWLTEAFEQSNLEPFHALEIALRCCGTNGASSYSGVSSIPNSCCADGDGCTVSNSYSGCIGILTDYLDSFGNGAGAFVIAIIAVEVMATLLGLFMACAVSNKNKGRAV